MPFRAPLARLDAAALARTLTQLRELNFHRYQVSLAEIETLVAGLPQLVEFNSDLEEGDGDRFKKRFPHCEFHSCW